MIKNDSTKTNEADGPDVKSKIGFKKKKNQVSRRIPPHIPIQAKYNTNSN